jgi:hypothetical protein
MVVIAGTNHLIQMAIGAGNIRAAKGLYAFLTALCREYAVCTVAEEMSAEALAQCKLTWSVPMQVAESLHIRHRFCDPDGAERRRLGVAEDESILRAMTAVQGMSERETESRVAVERAKRERYWLDQLRTLNRWPCLFVCGADHVSSFRKLLEIDGIVAIVAARDWQHT